MSTSYKIKDVAQRSGFTAATLRYYEEIGLLPEVCRTPAGYRLYDERTLERLAFITRAKQLGCTLEEISDLTLAWEGGQCGPVQDRLRGVVVEKLASAQQRIVELMTLTGDLQRAAAALEQHRPNGPCDDQCGCLSDSADADQANLVSPQGVTLRRSQRIRMTRYPSLAHSPLSSEFRHRSKKENAAIVGVGTAACVACCAGPIIGFLAVIGIGTAAGFACSELSVSSSARLVVVLVVRRRRQPAISCDVAAVPVPVETPTVRSRP